MKRALRTATCVHRSSHGQALVEGAAALILLTAMTVGAVLLILGTGTLVYYKIKLAGVADAAARQAVEGKFWLGAPRPPQQFDPATVESNIKTTVGTLLTAVGLPQASNVTVDLSRNDIATVTIKLNNLPIISGGILPGVVSMTETGAEPYAKDNPVGVLGLGYPLNPGAPGGGGGWYIPIYGPGINDPGPGTFPTSLFPYWQLDLFQSSGNPTTGLGPRQNWVAGPPFSTYF